MRSNFPATSDDLRVFAVAVSGFKALGWLALLAVTALYRIPIGERARLATMLLIGGALLFFQLRGVTLGRPGTLFVAAVLMTIVDGLAWVWFLDRNNGGGGRRLFVLTILGIVFICQLIIAIRTKPRRDDAAHPAAPFDR